MSEGGDAKENVENHEDCWGNLLSEVGIVTSLESPKLCQLALRNTGCEGCPVNGALGNTTTGHLGRDGENKGRFVVRE